MLISFGGFFLTEKPPLTGRLLAAWLSGVCGVSASHVSEAYQKKNFLLMSLRAKRWFHPVDCQQVSREESNLAFEYTRLLCRKPPRNDRGGNDRERRKQQAKPAR